jgi:hypothetical protein
MTGDTGASGGPQTVIRADAVLEVPSAVRNVKTIVEDPGAAEEDARTENAAGANAGGTSATDAGVTVTPAGRPEGVTVIADAGGQPPTSSEAVRVPAAPPPFRDRVEGAAAGVKAGGRTFATKAAVELMPRGSLTSAVSVVGPGAVPGAAATFKRTTRAGGIAGTGMVAGVTVNPAGRSGNVTVGVPE